MDTDHGLAVLRDLAGRFCDLHLLLLVGSRARGDEHRDSDWDLAYLATADFPLSAFLSEAIAALRTDNIDLADLATANALFRFEAADVGVRVVGDPGRHDRFRDEAIRFWVDAGPTIRAHYDEVLAALG